MIPRAGIISDFFTELTERGGVTVHVEAVTEDVEGVEDEAGEVFFFMDRALTNLSPKDPRSCMDGGSSLKNKLLYRRTNEITSKLHGLHLKTFPKQL